MSKLCLLGDRPQPGDLFLGLVPPGPVQTSFAADRALLIAVIRVEPKRRLQQVYGLKCPLGLGATELTDGRVDAIAPTVLTVGFAVPPVRRSKVTRTCQADTPEVIHVS